MVCYTFISAAVALALPIMVNAQYSLVKSYQGEKFFDDWRFYGKPDNLTNGNVNYVTASKGKKNKLAYVNSAGNAIMKVDNTTRLNSFGDKRDSVRIETKDHYTLGSVWVADMLHVPYGCSVWPAWWSHAVDWPSGGEIDTFEAVNAVTMSTSALHTNPGCYQVNATQTSTLVNSTDCSYLANANSGCTVTNPTTASYGEAFAKAGGGVWVTELAAAGVSIWFFTRSSVPHALTNGATTLDTSELGIPMANWPTQGCNTGTYFTSQSLLFDITLCGDYAGSSPIFTQTCSGVCYQDYVLGSPSNYDNAYFEVRSVNVYGLTDHATVVSGGPRGVTLGWSVSIMGAAVATIMAMW